MRILLTLILLTTLNIFGQQKLDIQWPEENNWKTVSEASEGNIHFVEVIPGKEKLKKWKLRGTMLTIKETNIKSMKVYIDATFEEVINVAPDAKLKIIEINETSTPHWALFTIECPRLKDSRKPESQLFYVVQGKTDNFTNIISVREKQLSEEFITKWSKIFLDSKLVTD